MDGDQAHPVGGDGRLLYGTANGGLTWVRLADPAATDIPALLADTGAGRAFLALFGITNGLRATFDGGLHWQTVLSVPGSDFEQWTDLTFLTAQDGYVVAVGYPAHLFRTRHPVST